MRSSAPVKNAATERETLRALVERVTAVPDQTAEFGFVVDLEGLLAEMLQVVGIKKADAELVDSASAFSAQLVAGAGFEPATFRL